jgi:hypothetical protein
VFAQPQENFQGRFDLSEYTSRVRTANGGRLRYGDDAMSKTEILAALPELNPQERREIARRIFELEDEAQLLADCDRRADERFLMLDAMEAEDAQAKSR